MHDLAYFGRKSDRRGNYWEIRCCCGWMMYSAKDTETDQRALEAHQQHVKDKTTPLRVGERVRVHVLDTAEDEQTEKPDLAVKLWDEDFTVRVPKDWCDRIGPVPEVDYKSEAYGTDNDDDVRWRARHVTTRS
jgi:hypothetical protein